MKSGGRYRLGVLFLAACMGSCSYSSTSSLAPGVTVEKIRRVQIGMSRQQVEFILGPPIQVDDFTENSLPYVRLWYSRDPASTWRYPALRILLTADRVVTVTALVTSGFDDKVVYWVTKGRTLELPGFEKCFPPGRCPAF
jgi:outer membrane protein assembly factor BamE (lipoprotein component of BamABCDE complex)